MLSLRHPEGDSDEGGGSASLLYAEDAGTTSVRHVFEVLLGKMFRTYTPPVLVLISSKEQWSENKIMPK